MIRIILHRETTTTTTLVWSNRKSFFIQRHLYKHTTGSIFLDFRVAFDSTVLIFCLWKEEVPLKYVNIIKSTVYEHLVS